MNRPAANASADAMKPIVTFRQLVSGFIGVFRNQALQCFKAHALANAAVARTRADINRLLHYGHPVPVSRGLTAEYVDTHFPGWAWNRLLEVLKAAGIVVKSKAGTLHCDPGVGAVHLDNFERWVVQWEDGRVTTCPGEAASDQCFT